MGSSPTPDEAGDGEARSPAHHPRTGTWQGAGHHHPSLDCRTLFPGTDPMIVAYRHTGGNVTALERSVAFYEALGFVMIERRREEGAYIDALTGLEHVRLDWVKVCAP